MSDFKEEFLANVVQDVPNFDFLQELAPVKASGKKDAHSLNQLLRLVEAYEEAVKVKGIHKWFDPEGDYPIDVCPKHKAFFKAGKEYPERLFMAANRVGKSIGGAYESTCHLTGVYPTWWEGRRFDHPVDGWAVGPDARTVRDTIQKELIGGLGEWGTGMIPAHLLGQASALQGTPQAIDIIRIKHVSGGWSTLGFKNYKQDIKAFMGTSRHFVWPDEECPIEIWNECNIRTATVKGIMYATFTPLQGLTRMVVNFCKQADFLEGARPIIALNKEDFDEIDEEKASEVVGFGIKKAVIQAGWDDAPWLDAETKERLLADTPEYLKDARSKGIPSMGAGAVYPIPLENVIVDPFTIPDNWPRMYGLDVGWNRCLAKDSMVLLPDGTQKAIQELKVGDTVLAFDFATENLVPTKVVDTFKGRASNMVTVGISEEQKLTCTDDHPFAHRAQAQDKIRFKKISEINGRIREFQSVVLPSRWDVEEEAEVCSPEMARVLGYLLGDGCLTYSNRRLEFAQTHEAFIDDMRSCLEAVGVKMSSYANNTIHHLAGQAVGDNAVLSFVRELGLLGTNSSTKFIPKQFLTANREIIKNLLVGLIHTDGSVEGDNVRYYTVSKQLAEGVKLLCLRLGIYASISKDTRKRQLTHNDVYRVTMRRPDCLPLLAPKKLVATRPERKKRADRLLTIYEKAPEQDIYCITVEHPDHAFVCNGFVVSNTAAVWAAMDPNTDTIYIYDEYYVGEQSIGVHALTISSKGKWIRGAIDPATRGRGQADGMKLLRLWKETGLKLIPAKNERESGISNILQRLATGRLKFFKTCTNLGREYILYRRRTNGTIEDENDHALDALRYVINNQQYFASKQESGAANGIKYTATRYKI